MQPVVQKDGEERDFHLTAEDQQKKVTAVLCSSSSHVDRCCICVARCMRASWAWLVQRFIRDIHVLRLQEWKKSI